MSVKGDQTRLAAYCARAAIEFDINEEYPPSKAELWRRSEKASGLLREIAKSVLRLPLSQED